MVSTDHNLLLPVQQKLEEVEVPHIIALFSPTISFSSIETYVREEVDVA